MAGIFHGNKNMDQIKCHDCGKIAEINNDEVTNGKFLTYKEDDKFYNIFKCTECFEKDKSLDNYKVSEVYSRVVGYIRPIAQFNVGKQQEYSDRKEYKLNETENGK